MNIKNYLLKINDSIKSYWHIYKLLSLILAILGFFLLFDGYLNNSINNQITNNDNISKISKSLRPYFLINLNGNIIYDHGAYKYINFIKMEPDTIIDITKIKSFKLGLNFKKPLQIQPIVDNLSSHEFIITLKRFGTTGWGIRFQVFAFVKEITNNESLIRIELIP